MNSITILIADGHRLIRETLSHHLDSDSCFQVMAACSGSKEAIETVKLLKPGAVLMDIR